MSFYIFYLFLLVILPTFLHSQTLNQKIEKCLEPLKESKDLSSLFVDIPYWNENYTSIAANCKLYTNTTKCLRPHLKEARYNEYIILKGLHDALNFICIPENSLELVAYQACYADDHVQQSLKLCRDWKNKTLELMSKNSSKLNNPRNFTCLVDETYQNCISTTLKNYAVCVNDSSLLQYYWRNKLMYYTLNATGCFSKTNGEDNNLYDNTEWSIILGVVMAVTIILFIIGVIMFLFFLYWRRKYANEDSGEEGSRGILRILGSRRDVPPPYALVVSTQAIVDNSAQVGVENNVNVRSGEEITENGGVTNSNHSQATKPASRPTTTLRLVDSEDRRVAETVARFYDGDTTNTTGNGLILPPPYPEDYDENDAQNHWKKQSKDKESKRKNHTIRNYKIVVYNNNNANIINNNIAYNDNEHIHIHNNNNTSSESSLTTNTLSTSGQNRKKTSTKVTSPHTPCSCGSSTSNLSSFCSACSFDSTPHTSSKKPASSSSQQRTSSSSHQPTSPSHQPMPYSSKSPPSSPHPSTSSHPTATNNPSTSPVLHSEMPCKNQSNLITKDSTRDINEGDNEVNKGVNEGNKDGISNDVTTVHSAANNKSNEKSNKSNTGVVNQLDTSNCTTGKSEPKEKKAIFHKMNFIKNKSNHDKNKDHAINENYSGTNDRRDKNVYINDNNKEVERTSMV